MAEFPALPPDNIRGFVYFIACDPLDAVKIGYTRGDPAGRLRALQTGCPSPLRLIDFAPSNEDEERRLHRAFAPLHIHGEWFRHDHKLRDFLYYLDHAPPGPADRSAFVSALVDVLDSRGFHPGDCGAAYAASASGEPFGFAVAA